MIRSRRLLAAASFAALAAWANVQAMACCVLPLASAVAAPAVEVDAAEAPMAADHSCCPGGASSPESAEKETPADLPGCGKQTGDGASLCCASIDAAAVSAKTVAPADAGAELLPASTSRLAASSAPPPIPRSLSSSPPDGAPPFLTYQRLLI